MKCVLLVLATVLLFGCATQQPPTFPASQAAGLSDEQGKAAAGALSGGGGIVYGGELGIGVSAPEGWIFDSQSGVSQGLHAVMYPVGSTWANAPEIMYVNIATLGSGQTLDAFIASDIESLAKDSPRLHTQTAPSITIIGGEQAQVRLFSGDKWGNYEATAYLQHGSGVAVYVLSSKTQAGFAKSFPAFKNMVSKSFAAKMQFEKGK